MDTIGPWLDMATHRAGVDPRMIMDQPAWIGDPLRGRFLKSTLSIRRSNAPTDGNFHHYCAPPDRGTVQISSMSSRKSILSELQTLGLGVRAGIG